MSHIPLLFPANLNPTPLSQYKVTRYKKQSPWYEQRSYELTFTAKSSSSVTLSTSRTVVWLSAVLDSRSFFPFTESSTWVFFCTDLGIGLKSACSHTRSESSFCICNKNFKFSLFAAQYVYQKKKKANEKRWPDKYGIRKWRLLLRCLSRTKGTNLNLCPSGPFPPAYQMIDYESWLCVGTYSTSENTLREREIWLCCLEFIASSFYTARKFKKDEWVKVWSGRLI